MKIAIIPARGGSKRIINKNVKKFCGKPIIAYSIETAKKSKLFDRIIISTDNKKIAKIAKQYGGEVPFIRPKSLSGDYTGTAEVIAHAVNLIKEKYNTNIKVVCCIYATAPFIQVKDLHKAWKLFKSGKWNFVFAATSYSYPVFRSFQKKENGGLKSLYPNHSKKRSQDLNIVLHDAGQFYWAAPNIWIKKKLNFNHRSTVVELPNWRVQDIDTMEDWKRAELKYKILRSI